MGYRPEDRGLDAIGCRPLVRGLAPDRDPRYLLTSRHVWSNATHPWGPGWSAYRSGRRLRDRCRLARGHPQHSAEAHGCSAAQRRALVRDIRFPNAVQYGEGVSDDRALRRPVSDHEPGLPGFGCSRLSGGSAAGRPERMRRPTGDLLDVECVRGAGRGGHDCREESEDQRRHAGDGQSRPEEHAW